MWLKSWKNWKHHDSKRKLWAFLALLFIFTGQTWRLHNFRVLLGETCEHLQRDISAKYHQVGYLNNQKGLKRADFASRCIEDTSIQHGNDGCFTRCPGGYGVMKALDTNFLSIELSSSMVTDHFLSGYISCLVDNEEEVVTIEVLLLVTNCTLVLEFESWSKTGQTSAKRVSLDVFGGESLKMF